MRQGLVIAALVGVLTCALTGCVDVQVPIGNPLMENDDCRSASSGALAAIASGLRDSHARLVDAQVVTYPLEQRIYRNYPTQILAARYVTTSVQDSLVGLWSVGNDVGYRPIYALDASAQLVTRWNSDADSNSIIARRIALLVGSESATKAKACLS